MVRNYKNSNGNPSGANRSHPRSSAGQDKSHAQKERGVENPRSRPPRSKQVVELIPHPEVLEGYNYVIEGSAEVILRMFETEQKHRQEWEDRALKFHNFSTMMGQIMGFLLVISVFISATLIGLYGNGTVAAFIWVFGMAILTMAGLVLVYVRSMGQRPLLRKPNFKRNYTEDYQSDQPKSHHDD